MGLKEMLVGSRQIEHAVCYKCGEKSLFMAYVLTSNGWECFRCSETQIVQNEIIKQEEKKQKKTELNSI